MAFLKAHWIVLVLAVVTLASIGGMVYAHIAGSEIETQMQGVSGLIDQVRNAQRGAVNRQVIEARKAVIEERNAELESTMDTALAMQRLNPFYLPADAPAGTVAPLRKPILDGVLPEPQNNAVALQFKTVYQEEHAKLMPRLRARGLPTPDEVLEEQRRLDPIIGQEQDTEEDNTQKSVWWPLPNTQSKPDAATKMTLQEYLRRSADAIAAERVAHSCYMYANEGVLAMHQLATSTQAPTAVDIWQAQMGLWIQQDIVTALASLNEERAAALEKAGRKPWVGTLPVKHLLGFAISPRLGKGGGLGQRIGDNIGESFTDVKNGDKMFVVPIQLCLVVEESEVIPLLDKLCSVGFYTPISVDYSVIMPNPFQKDAIYGDAPVVRIIVELEGYYFRKIFDEWIPEELKSILKKPDAMDDERQGRR